MEGIISESLLYILILTLTLRYLQFYWNRQQTKKLSGLSVVPFLGDVITIIKYSSDVFLLVINLIFKRNSDWFGPCLGAFVKEPCDAEMVLGGQKTLGKDMKLYKIIIPFVGYGIVTTDVATWRKDRKLISPSFSQKNTIGYYNIFYDNACQLVKDLKKEEGKGTFDVYHYLSKINLRTICETSLGVENNSNVAEKYDELIDIVDRCIEAATRRLTNLWYLFDLSYKLSPFKRYTEESASTYHNLMSTIIAAGKTQHYLTYKKTDYQDKPTKKIKYLLEDLLVQHHDGKRYSNQEVEDHINTVVFAGYETSAATLGYVLVILGIYPDIQEKVYQEIVDVVGTNRSIEIDDLKNLQYMERVIKETLRIFPVAPYLARIAEEDIVLSTETVPAGSSIVVGILNIHTDPKIWPNPEKFDPERFLPEEISKRHSYSWIPFSAGPRNCLGIRYAWITMKVMLTTLLKEYYIKADYKDVQEIPVTARIVSKPRDGHLIKIEKRNCDISKL